MQRLTENGLPATTYLDPDGRPCVNTRGLDITVVPIYGGCQFSTALAGGSVVGDTRDLSAVVTHLLWLFGRTPRTRH